MRLIFPNKAVLFFSLLCLVFASAASYAQRLIWVEYSNDRIMEGVFTPGGIANATPLITGLNGPTQLTLDISDERIFYTTNFGEDIYKASIYDGSSPQVVITTGAMVYFEDIVYSGSNTIFATMNSEVEGVYSIPDNNNDGGSETSLPLGGYNNAHHLGIAVSDGWALMFIINLTDNVLYSTNLGGTYADDFVTSLSNLEYVAVDDDNSIIYFTRVNSSFQNEIYSCDYYGGNVTQIANVGAGQMKCIQTLPDKGKILYLIDNDIRQMNTDGTGITTLISLPGTGVSDFAIAPDVEPPVFTALTPADNATGISPSITQVSMTFSEPMFISTTAVSGNTGDIILHENGTPVATIPRSSSSINISGNIVTITLPMALAQGNNYNILVGSSVFSDFAGNNFIGISLATGWNFTTSCTLASSTPGTTQTVCNGGDPAVLSGGIPTGGNGTYAYQWESSTTSSSGGYAIIPGADAADYDPPSGITTTTYYRRVVNSGVCTPVTGNFFTVNVTSPPSITAHPVDAESCEGDVAVFNVTVTGTALTYQWYRNSGGVDVQLTDDAIYGGTTSDQLTVYDATGLNNATFWCEVSSSGICPVVSNSATLTVIPFAPLVDQTPSVCEDVAGSGSALFDLTTLSSAIASQSGVTLAWYLDDDYVSTVPVPTSTAVTNGTVIYVEGTLSPSGCTRRSTITFSVATKPSVVPTPADPVLCSGSTTTVNLSVASSWTFSNNPAITGATTGTGTSITLNLTNTSSTRQQIDYTIIPTVGACIGDSFTLPVLVDPVPAIFNITGGGPYCEGTGGSAIGLSGSQAGVTYDLLLNGSTTGVTFAGTGSSFEFAPVTATGTYTVRATGTGSCTALMNGSVSDVQMSVLPSGAGIINGNTLVCDGRSEVYQVTGISNATSFEWSTGDGALSESTNTLSLDVTGTSNVILSVVGINSCGRGGSGQLTLNMLPPPAVDIVLPADVYAEEEASFSYTTANDQAGAWSFGDGGSASGSPAFHTYANGGAFEVTVQIIENGCIGRDTKTLVVKPKATLSDHHIKNAVTANGDQKNAFLYIQDIHKFPDNEVILIDRWGVEVFRARGYQNDWDLTRNGDYLPAGNYVCIVKLDETGETFKRTVTVVRGR